MADYTVFMGKRQYRNRQKRSSGTQRKAADAFLQIDYRRKTKNFINL